MPSARTSNPDKYATTSRSAARAKFVAFEGADGSGKSTLLARVEEDFRARGLIYLMTREPGGTPVAEEIREIILRPGRALDPRAELLLFEASRAEHVAQLIRPALAKGQHVLCDRFTHSSLAYQGVARGLGEAQVRVLNAFATNELEPDAVVWLRLEPRVAQARVDARSAAGAGHSRIDAEKTQFHEKVFEAFERMSKSSEDAKRFIVLDAAASPDAVFEELRRHPLWTRMFS